MLLYSKRRRSVAPLAPSDGRKGERRPVKVGGNHDKSLRRMLSSCSTCLDALYVPLADPFYSLTATGSPHSRPSSHPLRLRDLLRLLLHHYTLRTNHRIQLVLPSHPTRIPPSKRRLTYLPRRLARETINPCASPSGPSKSLDTSCKR